MEQKEKEITSEEQEDGWYVITTPFLDRHNDYTQIFCKNTDDGKYYLSDFGETIQDLELYGFDYKNEKRREEIKSIINGFGIFINWESKELYIEFNEENFPQNKNNFIQAIISIRDGVVLYFVD